MIISVSYKTDIPAFYGEWFLNRLDAGYCVVQNHYNRKVSRVSLNRNDVSGFVFWTKNLRPFVDKLEVVSKRGYPFVVQYAITGYPRSLELSVTSAERAVQDMRLVAIRYGPRVAVWRYDAIVFSSVTPVDFHLRNFQSLAQKLEGATDEVVVSFAQIYKKTRTGMNQAAERFGFQWNDPTEDIKVNLAGRLAQIAKEHGIQLAVCSQRQFVAPGIADARCVDVVRLSDTAGHRIKGRLKGNRNDCGCYASTDIGEYDTCPHGCVYCYAVRSRNLARTRYRNHDPFAEGLFYSPGHDKPSVNSSPVVAPEDTVFQGRLF